MERLVNILVVEDSQADFQLLERHLRQQGLSADCFRVERIDQLRDALGKESWDLVLSDYSLPHIDFSESLNMIQNALPEVPVILVSGSVGEERAVELLKLGVSDFVLKDNLIRLIPSIERALKEADERRTRLSAEYELRQSEARYRVLEERFRFIFEGALDGILIADAKTRQFVISNPAVIHMLGYGPEEITELSVQDIHPKAELPHVMEEFERQLRGEIQLAADIPVLRKDGSIFYADIMSSPVTIDGKHCLMGVFRDITQRKEAAEALKKSEVMYRSLFDNMMNSVAHCRMIFQDGVPADMEYISVNPAFKTVTGIKEDVAGRKISEVIPGYCQENPESIEMFGQVAMTGKPAIWEHYLASLDRWFSFSIYSPGFGEVVIITDNITERKKAEMERAKYQHQLELLLETAGEGIFGVNSDGNITFVNKAAAGLIGFSRDELIGRSSHDVFHSHRSDGALYPWHDCPLCRTLHDGITRSGEETYLKADGSGFPIEFTCTAIVEGGGITGAVMIFRDITERRKIESQLRQAQKLEGIGQLAGGIAHDFNNVLNAVVGYAGLLQMKMDKSDPLVHYADEISAAGQRGAALTQQILAFSRKQVLDMKPVNLNEVVKSLQKMFHRLVQEDIDIHYELADEDLVIFADISQLDQILINLVTNARDAMPGGGRLSIGTRPFVMDREFPGRYGYGSPGAYAMLTVSDTGCGMNAEIRSHIFEPFFTTKESGKGTGLGLAVVHGIVKQHNGYIDLHSVPGQGTRFKIYLPLTAYTIEEIEKKTAVQAKGGTETILIAEDEASLRRLTTAILNQYGYRVIEAADGEEAVRKFAEHIDEITLVVLDGIMPKKNGKEAYAEIRRLRPDMKAIFMSGYAEDILNNNSSSGKAAVFMQKPVLPNDLLRKVREVLDG